MGGTLLAVTPQRIELNRKLIEERKLEFEIVRDAGNEVAHQYGLRWSLPDDLKELYLKFGIDLAASNGEESWTLALPARMIVDSSGVIRYLRVDTDYTRRPEPGETLEELRRLVG